MIGIVFASSLSMLRMRLVASRPPITGIRNPAAAIAIGEFRHRQTGDTYVMILNKDLKNSVSIGGLNWRNTPAAVQVFSQQRPGKVSAYGGWNGEGTWLAPGHAILLKVSW